MHGQVETYSGYRLHEGPRRFTWEGEWLEVRCVLKRERTPQHLNFQVEAGDGRVYLLTYGFLEDAWEIQLNTAKYKDFPGP
jgi:hypothetical protein